MATAFDEVQFPTDIAYGSVGGAEFNTEIITLGSGHEQRNQNWSMPRERWEVAYGVDTEAKLLVLREFHMARKGMAVGFRFKNHDDFEGTLEAIGTGNAVETEFQLVKNYTSGAGSLVRNITKPVEGSETIYLDGSPQGSTYSFDITSGIITFDSAPGDGVAITATFEFDVPMRFDTDYLSIQFVTYEARAASVPIVEIRTP